MKIIKQLCLPKIDLLDVKQTIYLLEMPNMCCVLHKMSRLPKESVYTRSYNYGFNLALLTS